MTGSCVVVFIRETTLTVVRSLGRAFLCQSVFRRQLCQLGAPSRPSLAARSLAPKPTTMDEASLLAAVRELKLEQPLQTAKEVFATLTAAGKTVELSAVKKACGKVTKALENEPTPPTAADSSDSKLPPLVSPPTGSVAFLRCHTCQVRTNKARVCGGCHAVCYCSSACQKADASHAVECDACKRHMATDVRVALPGAAWLEAAMGHRCELSTCELLEAMGAHQAEAYRLLCGCALPSAQHRYVVASIPAPEAEAEVAAVAGGAVTGATAPFARVPWSWASYYEGRAGQLPPASPLAPQHGQKAAARSRQCGPPTASEAPTACSGLPLWA